MFHLDQKTKKYSWRDTNGYGEEEEINSTPPLLNSDTDIYSNNFDQDNSDFIEERKNQIIKSSVSLWEKANIFDSFFYKADHQVTYHNSDSESESESIIQLHAKSILSATFIDVFTNKNDDSDEGLYSDSETDSETFEISEISESSSHNQVKGVDNKSNNSNNSNQSNNANTNSNTQLSNEQFQKSKGKGAKGKCIEQNPNQKIFKGPKKGLMREHKSRHLYNFFEIEELPLKRLKSKPFTNSQSIDKFPNYFQNQLKLPKLPHNIQSYVNMTKKPEKFNF